MIEDTRTWLRRLNVSEDAVEEINAAIFKLVQSAGRQEAEVARLRGSDGRSAVEWEAEAEALDEEAAQYGALYEATIQREKAATLRVTQSEAREARMRGALESIAALIDKPLIDSMMAPGIARAALSTDKTEEA